MYPAGGLTLDELITKLQKLRSEHGGSIRCITAGGEYPEGTGNPKYNKDEKPYYPANTIIID